MSQENGELLESLLGMLGDNPEEKIKSALSSLGVGEKEERSEKPTMPSGLDPEMLLKLGSIFSSSGTDDKRTALLCAIKPFMSEERQPKVDSALKLLKLAKMAEMAGKTDILKNLKL